MHLLTFRKLLPGLALAASVFLLSCSKKEAAPELSTDARTRDNLAASTYQQTLPRHGAEGYVGSAACIECHKDEHASWYRTYHRTMTQVASTNSMKADFNNVVLTNANTRFTLFHRTNEYWVRMELIAESAAGGGMETRIGLITGSHHMQVFWIPEGTGNLQIGFPFTWLIPEKRWVPRNSTFVRPPGFNHRPEAWNIVCSRCHTTGVEPRFEASSRWVDTRVAELGISCEACHGPAERHVALRRSKPRSEPHQLDPGEIVHPEKFSAERSAQICGFCHSMKWIDAGENWRKGGFKFRPGDDLEQTTPIIRASSTNNIPGLAAYLASHPETLRDFFWPDGMIRVSGREYNGLIESPCMKSGKFSCLSCHSGHNSEPNDMLAPIGKGNNACLQCHEELKDSHRLTAHTRHTPNSAGSECYNCHMPHTTYGVLKAIRSHQISSPRVADDLIAGRPNACNLCHLDQTLGWTAQHLSRWYDQQSTPLTEASTNLAHAVRLAVAGDAGQRIVVAWHLGWEPALKISGTNWIAPFLGELLDDPYAAVRLVAERSAKHSGVLNLRDYDYTIEPTNRLRIREQVWNLWLDNVRSGRQADHSTVRPTLYLSPTNFDALRRLRNDRPVRLRE